MSTTSDAMIVDEAPRRDTVELKSSVQMRAPANEPDIVEIRRKDPNNKEVPVWNVTLVAKDFRSVDSGVQLSHVAEKVSILENASINVAKNLYELQHKLGELEGKGKTNAPTDLTTTEVAEKVVAVEDSLSQSISILKTNQDNVNSKINAVDQDVKRIGDMHVADNVMAMANHNVLKDNIRATESAIEATRIKMVDMDSNITKNKEDILDVATSVAQMDDVNKKHVADMATMMSALITRIEKLEGESETMRRFEIRLVSVEENIEVIKKTIVNLDVEKASNERVSTLREDLEEVDSRMITRDTLESELDHYALQEDFDNLESKVEDMDDGMDRMKDRLNELEQTAEEKEHEIAQLRKEIVENKDSIWSTTKKVEQDVFAKLEEDMEKIVTKLQTANEDTTNAGKNVSDKLDLVSSNFENSVRSIAIEVKELREAYNADLLRVERGNRDAMDSVAADLVKSINDVKSNALNNTVDLDNLKGTLEMVSREVSDIKEYVERSVLTCD